MNLSAFLLISNSVVADLSGFEELFAGAIEIDFVCSDGNLRTE